MVTSRANEGGGWLTWVLSVGDIKTFESRLGRESVDGQRRRPNGTDLKWKQLGVLGTLEDRQLPFFIEWLTSDHPSTEGNAVTRISKLEIAGDPKRINEWIGEDFNSALEGIDIVWVDPSVNKDETGLLAVHFSTPSGNFKLE